MIRCLCVPVLEPAFHAMSASSTSLTQQELLLAGQCHRRELALRRIVSFAEELEVVLERLREVERYDVDGVFMAQELTAAIRRQCTWVWNEQSSSEIGDDSRSRSRSGARNSTASQAATELDSD